MAVLFKEPHCTGAIVFTKYIFKMWKLIIFTLTISLGISLGKVAPDYIKICKGLKSDCLTETIQRTIPEFTKGIPELGVIPTDPLINDLVRLELPGNFKVQLNNGSLTGLRKCIVDSVNYANDAADLTLRCNVTIKGRYRAKGNILIVTINGDGDAKIKIKNIQINAHIKFADVVRDGVVYYDIKDYSVKHTHGDKVSFALTNLFEGNPELSQAVLQFLNENWKQVSEEFGEPIFETLVTMMFQTVKTFFAKIPKDELIQF